jgi:hypothetical protein
MQAELAAAAERVEGYRARYRLQLAADQRVLSQDVESIKVRLSVARLFVALLADLLVGWVG